MFASAGRGIRIIWGNVEPIDPVLQAAWRARDCLVTAS